MPPKTLGKRARTAAPQPAGKAPAPAANKVGSRRAAPGAVACRGNTALGEAELDLVERLAERTGLLPREILERALSAYAAAVAPGLPLSRAGVPGAAGRTGLGATGRRGKGAQSAAPKQRLFISIDGKPEVEVGAHGVFLGRDPGCEVVLDLPLISPRHARVIAREGRWIFEDLRSARGTWRHGEKFEVRFIEDGDEYDLGGFLPIRARLV